MLPQTTMIERTRLLCQQDERLVAALMYGSFTLGEGDAFSDIEFVLFFADDQVAGIDQRAWVSQIAPVLLYFADDVGHHTAIFANLVRGEFHFKAAAEIPMVATWRGSAWFPSYESTVLIDRSGDLAALLAPLIGAPPPRDTPAAVESLAANFMNWMLFGSNVLLRGELARALEILSVVQRSLLWMARLVEGATDHWPTPSRKVELEISAGSYHRFQRCTAPLERAALWQAYQAAWQWGAELMVSLTTRHGLALPAPLLEQLSQRFAAER